MRVRSPQFWLSYVEENSSDLYSRNVVTYAEQWADLMEAAMAQGQSLESVAKRLSHEADTTGITRFQYGVAVEMLSQHWIHGEQLRLWHNAEYGVTEQKAQGGVVNPAVIPFIRR